MRDLLNRHGLHPSKGFGQNFLIDENALNRIIAAAELEQGDVVIEVGPGLGTLTQALAAQAGAVIAIEKDNRLLPALQETVGGMSNVRIINADALQVEYRSLLPAGCVPKVVANLPYYITTPLIMGFLESGIAFSNLVFLVQREVAERMVAKPGGKDYGALSVAVQFRTEPSIATHVSPGAFYPAPKVSSSVVRLVPQDTARYGLETDEVFFFRIVRHAFGQRRKTLLNALAPVVNGNKELLKEVLKQIGVSENIRGEALSVQQFVALANVLASRQAANISASKPEKTNS